MAKRTEVKEKLFGHLTAIEPDHLGKSGEWYWKCLCICGNTHTARISHLQKGTVWRCQECKAKSRIKPKLIGEMSHNFWNMILLNAQSRNIKVEITAEEAYQKFLGQNGLCAISGVKITFPPTTNKRKLGTASLDRKDSTKPYTKDNIQWVHKIINKMKMDLSEETFSEWCKIVTEHKGKTCQL